MEVDIELRRYVEENILPRYQQFDKAHRVDHALSVIRESLRLSAFYPETEADMVYVVAAYHDTGLVNGRENHHIDSGKILLSDECLRRWFDDERLRIMADAVEDHRASSGREPRSIYGKIVAEADRLIDVDTVMLRTVQYGLKHYPGLSEEEHYKRVCEHLREKYLEGGYIRLWIPESENGERLARLRALAADDVRLRSLFNKYYLQEK
ncbi:MAG: HD domain-containing protein [Candidatus Limimorpha sp.]